MFHSHHVTGERAETFVGANWAKLCLPLGADGATGLCPECRSCAHAATGSSSPTAAQELHLFSLTGMPSLWPGKSEPECMPSRKTWWKWTPKWSWRCLPASWGMGWRGCKAQKNKPEGWRSQPWGSAQGAPGIQRTIQASPQSWTLETLYEIPESAYLFGQVASTVLSNRCFSLLFFFLQKIHSPTDFFIVWNSTRKKKVKKELFADVLPALPAFTGSQGWNYRVPNSYLIFQISFI